MKTERAIDKIKKLLALSKSTNPHEAATALRQAQNLMAKHNISNDEINMSSISETHFYSKVSVSRIKVWEWTLVSGIAKAFGCDAFFGKGNSHGETTEEIYAKYTYVGVRSQVEIAGYTINVVLRKIVKAKNEFSKSLPQKMSRADKTAQINGFLHGWSKEIMKTVHAFAESDEVTLAIESYMGKHYPNMTSGKCQNQRIGQNGVLSGMEAARGESINRPVNGQGQARLN